MVFRGGKPRGTPTPGGFEEFDPTSRRSTRVTVSLPADVAPKVIAAARAMNKSVSWYLAELARFDAVNTQGVPEWFKDEHPQQPELADGGEDFAMTG